MNIERRHDSRCNRCKSTIYAALAKLHGQVEHKFKSDRVSVMIDDYRGTQVFEALKKIYDSLVAFRGFNQFVKLKTLQRCDLFIPAIGAVIEVDEVQHFSEPRAIALEQYPSSLTVGFDKNAYIQRCRNLRSRDNDPLYRDEQRAWYDTIRDFLPLICPERVRHATVRIPLGFHEWCQFNADDSAHVNHFRELVGV